MLLSKIKLIYLALSWSYIIWRIILQAKNKIMVKLEKSLDFIGTVHYHYTVTPLPAPPTPTFCFTLNNKQMKQILTISGSYQETEVLNFLSFLFLYDYFILFFVFF